MAEELPSELEDLCSECHKSLVGVERILKPLLSMNRAQVEEKLGTLDSASEVLLLAYTMNSLFWVYLAIKGVNPKSHLIKQELERVQKVMNRARSVSRDSKSSGIQVNSGAAKRFIRSALWEGGREGEGDPEEQDGKRKKRRVDIETDR